METDNQPQWPCPICDKDSEPYCGGCAVDQLIVWEKRLIDTRSLTTQAEAVQAVIRCAASRDIQMVIERIKERKS